MIDLPLPQCITYKELLERIVRLETSDAVRVEEKKEALVLARTLLSKELELTRNQVAEKLEGHNQWQRRWDKNEAVFATKVDMLDKITVVDDKFAIRIRNLERLVFIGVGIAVAVQFFFGYIR